MQQGTDGTSASKEYVVRDGLLYWKDRLLVVPNQEALIQQILREYHVSPVGGHAGVTRSVARISAQLYWPKLREHVKEFIKNCSICQQAKSSNTLPAGLLNHLPIPAQVWDDVAMDFITGLPNSQGLNVIMVVVDILSK